MQKPKRKSTLKSFNSFYLRDWFVLFNAQNIMYTIDDLQKEWFMNEYLALLIFQEEVVST